MYSVNPSMSFVCVWRGFGKTLMWIEIQKKPNFCGKLELVDELQCYRPQIEIEHVLCNPRNPNPSLWR